MKLSRLDLYQRCVQNPAAIVPMLLAIHGGERRPPTLLREDFSGAAAVSRAWVRVVKNGRAVAVDSDAAPLARVQSRSGITPVVGDATAAATPGTRKADVIYVGNFSIGEIHDRGDLVRYLRACRRRLAPGGMFICDIYGGKSAFRTGSVHRLHSLGDRCNTSIRYTWEQREADARTRMVTNAMHFRVIRGGKTVQVLKDAFIYRWRLWSIVQLRSAMRDAGFANAAIYGQSPDARDSDGRYHAAPRLARDLDPSYIVFVAARG